MAANEILVFPNTEGKIKLDQIIMALCSIFDEIKHLSTLWECDMTDFLPEKDYVTRGLARWKAC